MKSQDDFMEEKNSLREAFKQKYPDLKAIKQADIHRLLWLLDSALDEHAMAGNIKMNMVPLNSFVAKMIREKGIGHKGLELKVNSHYFNGREGITFGKDGKVWFCGWAGGNNHEPFIEAFKKWLLP